MLLCTYSWHLDNVVIKLGHLKHLFGFRHPQQAILEYTVFKYSAIQPQAFLKTSNYRCRHFYKMKISFDEYINYILMENQ